MSGTASARRRPVRNGFPGMSLLLLMLQIYFSTRGSMLVAARAFPRLGGGPQASPSG
jgi:hypothetical protein